jgi:hypothetical protein
VLAGLLAGPLQLLLSLLLLLSKRALLALQCGSLLLACSVWGLVLTEAPP